MNSTLRYLLFILAFLISSAQDNNALFACTGLMLTRKNKNALHGRTLEFGIKVEASITFIPRNISFISKTTLGDGLKYNSKYAALGTTAFKNPLILDGMNEKGLSIGTFYFPGYASYVVTTKENQSTSLSPADFPNWILTQFETVEEVKEAIKQVTISPIEVSGWGNEAPPFHYIVYDKRGKCLVIEPLDQKLISYDNPIGVFTNSPDFNWHLTNLNNYINLSVINSKPQEINGITFKGFGQGSGLLGLPGDFTPPSRFVRAVIFSLNAEVSSDEQTSIATLFHLLNPFDIPVGSVKDKENGKTFEDSTQITCVRDPEYLKYYFKTYEDQRIKCVDLKKFDPNQSEILSVDISGNETYLDISKNLKPYT